MTQTLILILGMGRSGTSAMAKVLELCGANLPDKLLGPHPSNVKGHFEPEEALGINEEFLTSLRSSWFDAKFRIQDEAPSSRSAAFVARISKFLSDNADRSPLVVKDPRITALTKYWFDAAGSSGWDVKVVIPVRHPDEVFASLASRDGVSEELSNALWKKYNLLAERETRDLPRVFVGYRHLLDDPHAQIQRVARALALELEFDSAGVDEFLDTRLRHHSLDEVEPADAVAAQLFAILARLCVDEPVELNELDALYERIRR